MPLFSVAIAILSRSFHVILLLFTNYVTIDIADNISGVSVINTAPSRRAILKALLGTAIRYALVAPSVVRNYKLVSLMTGRGHTVDWR